MKVETLDLDTTPFGCDKRACLERHPFGLAVGSLTASMLIGSAVKQATGPFLLKGLRISKRVDTETLGGSLVRLNAHGRARIVALTDEGLLMEAVKDPPNVE